MDVEEARFGMSSSSAVQTSAEGRLVVYPSRVKLVLLALGALVFIVAGLWLGGVFGDLDLPLGLVVITTYIGVPFFGLCLVYILYRLVVRKPSLVVSEEGIVDNASATGAGPIGWDEVAEIQPTNVSGKPMLGIVPHDEEQILARQNLIKRSIMSINRNMTGFVILIPENALPMSIDDLLVEIKRYRRASGLA